MSVLPRRESGYLVNYLGTKFSHECETNGSGQCDGYIYELNGEPCACFCHSENGPEFLTIAHAEEWHAEHS